MSTTKPRKGHPRKPVSTRRGQLILARLDELGLTMIEAAAKAQISYDALTRVVHERDPGWLQVRTVVAVCEHLGVPLEVMAPCLAPLAGKTAPEGIDGPPLDEVAA